MVLTRKLTVILGLTRELAINVGFFDAGVTCAQEVCPYPYTPA